MVKEIKDNSSSGCLWIFTGFFLFCFLIAGNRDGYEKTVMKIGEGLLLTVITILFSIILVVIVYLWLDKKKR